MIIIPVYNVTILPNAEIPFPLARFKELSATEPQVGMEVCFLYARDNRDDTPLTQESLYPVGISGTVDKIGRGGYVSIKTTSRVLVRDFHIEADEQRMSITLSPCPDSDRVDVPFADFKDAKKRVLKRISETPIGDMMTPFVRELTSYSDLLCFLSPYTNLSNEERYALVEENSAIAREHKIRDLVLTNISEAEVMAEAQEAEEEENRRLYRENALMKQMDYLQKELDNLHGEDGNELDRLEKRINESGMNKEARQEADRVFSRLKQENPSSAEYGLLSDYLEFMTSLNWHKEEYKHLDIQKASDVLDRDHYGLTKIKKRILEQLAVMNKKQSLSGTILCFSGAPGTGKTSIGISIAEALDRPFVRISLGGVHDESDIRGHRRTYIGAMPGRILNGISKCGSSAPVVLLDEVDKMNVSYNGDPSSALLEVLDPEQNSTFTDHYLNAPYDLSDVLFICTANNPENIAEPLLNRMEIIPFDGYTRNEKFHIAKEHLLRKALKNTGVTNKEFSISDEAIRVLIDEYTAESGVRNLKRVMEKLCRQAAISLESGHKKVSVNARNVRTFFEEKPLRHQKALSHVKPGIVTGLAWTSVGGEILFIETLLTKGEGKLHLTGSLGDVMKESAELAVTLVKSMYPEQASLFKENDLHIHVPEGATPKDGPSAGITLTCALTSLVCQKAIDPSIGMTGEITLRGSVTAIGGLNEKLLAAQRAGLKKILIPFDNKEDLKDISHEVLDSLEIIPVKDIQQALKQLNLPL